MNIVIVMPTYNEAENIIRMIEILCGNIFRDIETWQHHIRMHLLVVDDNSPDGTGEIVQLKVRDYSSLHLLSGERNGLGNAYVRGFKFAINRLNADAVIEMDADFQHNPEYIKDFVESFLNGADYVIGSRYTDGGSIPSGWEWYRRSVSNYGNLFAKFMLRLEGINDLTTGFRLTRVKGILDKIDLDNLMALKRFAYKVDLMHKTSGLSKKTIEVPIHFNERVKEVSKFSFMEMVETYRVVMLLWFYDRFR